MRRLKFLILLAWLAGLLAVEAWRYPVPLGGAAALAGAAASAGGVLLTALLLGRLALRRFRLFHGSLVEEAVLSLALGLLALSLLGSAIGAAGALYPWLCRALLGVICLVCWGHAESLGETLRRSLRSKRPWSGSSLEVATVLALALAALPVAAMCLAPPKFFDALVYHLAQAQHAAASGWLRPQDHVLFTWLPSLPTPVWAWALAVDGSPRVSAQAAGLLDLALYGALGLLLVDASARLFQERRIWMAPALALTQPLLALSFGVFSPDAWSVFFAFASLDAFLLGLVDPVRRTQDSWILLSALLAGAAVACKPVALIHAAALLALLGTLAWRERSWRRPGLLFTAVGLFLVPLVPWMAQGLALKGQPFYPFPLRLFGLTFFDGGPASYFRHVGGFGGRGLWAWVRLPWAAFFDAGSLGADGILGVLLLALAPACLTGRLDRPLRWILAYLGLGCLGWLLGPHVLRYGVCLVPAAALLAAHGVSEAETRAASRGWARLWQGLVVAGLLFTAAQTLAIAVKDFDPLPVALGLEAPEAYLGRMGVPQAAVGAWILAQKPEGAGVLVLGDERTAYLPPDCLAASVYDRHPLAEWVGRARSPQEVDARVRAKGYDFVYFNFGPWMGQLRTGSEQPYWPVGDAQAEARFMAWVAALRALPRTQRLDLGGAFVARIR